jgi:hypothetical protein
MIQQEEQGVKEVYCGSGEILPKGTGLIPGGAKSARSAAQPMLEQRDGNLRRVDSAARLEQKKREGNSPHPLKNHFMLFTYCPCSMKICL